MFTVLLISIILLSISVAGLAFNIIFRRKGRFPSFRVGHNKEMKKLGITCVKQDELNGYKQPGKNTCGCEVPCQPEK